VGAQKQGVQIDVRTRALMQSPVTLALCLGRHGDCVEFISYDCERICARIGSELAGEAGKGLPLSGATSRTCACAVN
jgi:hypothetical protein